MMLEQIILAIALLAWLFVRAARLAKERQSLLDLCARDDVPLSERRAVIAADAGASAFAIEALASLVVLPLLGRAKLRLHSARARALWWGPTQLERS
jgi:hypothetical protein